MRPDAEYLRDILVAVERITEVIEGVSASQFTASRDLLDIVRWNFLVIGEASAQLSESTRRLSPEVAWREIVGFRNVLVHGYFSLELERIYTIATTDLDSLLAAVRTLLATIAQEDDDEQP